MEKIGESGFVGASPRLRANVGCTRPVLFCLVIEHTLWALTLALFPYARVGPWSAAIEKKKRNFDFFFLVRLSSSTQLLGEVVALVATRMTILMTLFFECHSVSSPSDSAAGYRPWKTRLSVSSPNSLDAAQATRGLSPILY